MGVVHQQRHAPAVGRFRQGGDIAQREGDGSSGQSQRTSKSSRAAAYRNALWTFRPAATRGRFPGGVPAFHRARASMARMHWEDPSVEKKVRAEPKRAAALASLSAMMPAAS